MRGKGVGWGGRLFEAGCLLTFSAFRIGAYSRWALIRGWALIRIYTVFVAMLFCTTVEPPVSDHPRCEDLRLHAGSDAVLFMCRT